MRRSSSLFMQNSKPIVGYDNVSYDISVYIPPSAFEKERYEWVSVGNLGYKTIAEYNDLLAQMDSTTKRNLQGDRVY